MKVRTLDEFFWEHIIVCTYCTSFCLHCHSILIATNFDCYDSVKVASNGGNPLLHQITLDFLPQGTQSTMPLKWLCVWQFSNCGPVDKFGHLYFCFLQLFEEIVAYIFNTRHWLPRNLPPAVSAAIVKPFKAIKPRAAWNSYCLTQAKNLNVKKFCEGLMWSLFLRLLSSLWNSSLLARGVGKTFDWGGTVCKISFVVQDIYGTDWKLGGHVPPVPPWFLRLC